MGSRFVQIGQKSLKSKSGFITPIVRAVFEFFLKDPMKEYYEREVARKTDASIGSASKIPRLPTRLDFHPQITSI